MDLANVLICRSAGSDLRLLRAGTFDLILFLDSFPYLVEIGDGLPERHFLGAAEALTAQGRIVIANFSYRDDLARDVVDVEALAAAAGLRLRSGPDRPFHHWDGLVFQLTLGADGSFAFQLSRPAASSTSYCSSRRFAARYWAVVFEVITRVQRSSTGTDRDRSAAISPS